MELGKRTVFALLLGLVCLNVAVRQPSMINHETGVDSFFIHTLAESINRQGQAEWIINALSFFGLYTLSYPSVGPLSYAAASQMSGLSIEGSILLSSFLIGAAGVAVSFMMARSLRRDDVFTLSVTFASSLAPRFITFTMWTGSTRGLFMLLLPVFLWAVLTAYRQPTKRHIALVVLILGLAAATHRLWVLLSLVLLAFVVTYIFVLALRLLRLRIPRFILNPKLRRYAALLTLAVLAATTLVLLLQSDVLKQYEQSQLGGGDTTVSQLIALGGSIGRSVGLALPLALVGVTYLPFVRNKGIPEILILLILLALVPTLFLRHYTGFYITPFIALFCGFGVTFLYRALRKRRRAAVAVVVSSLVLLTATSMVARNWELAQTVYIPDWTYNAGLYVRYLPGESTFVANHGLMGVHVASISGKPYLPVGGAGTTSQSPELLAFGYFSPQDVYNNTVRLPLQDLRVESDSPFELYGVKAGDDWAGILQDDNYGLVSRIIQERYNLAYHLDREELGLFFWANDKAYDSTFARSMHFGYSEASVTYDARYKMLDVGPESLWVIYPQRAFR